MEFCRHSLFRWLPGPLLTPNLAFPNMHCRVELSSTGVHYLLSRWLLWVRDNTQ
jgi:hypothetical protein